MNQWVGQILVMSAITLPPVAVFFIYEMVNSGLFLAFPLSLDDSPRKIHFHITLSGFSKLHSFPGVKLIGLALGINIATLFYSWIDEDMNLVLKTPGPASTYISAHLGTSPFIFLFILIIVEGILICWVSPKSKKSHEAELRNTVARLSQRAPRVISQLKEGEIRPFDKWIEKRLRETMIYLKHQERSSTARVGCLILILAILMILF